MNQRDETALSFLQKAYEDGDDSDRSLLCFDPDKLLVVDVRISISISMSMSMREPVFQGFSCDSVKLYVVVNAPLVLTRRASIVPQANTPGHLHDAHARR